VFALGGLCVRAANLARDAVPIIMLEGRLFLSAACSFVCAARFILWETLCVL